MLRTLVLYITYGLLLSIVCATNKANAQNFEWLRLMRGSGSVVNIKDVCSDNFNNVFVIGEFKGTVIHPSTNLTLFTSTTYQNVFIAKFTSSGNLIWAKHIYGNNNLSASAIAVDNQNRIYVTGSFKDSITFSQASPQFTKVNSTPGSPAYLAQYDSAGNTLWATSIITNDGYSNGYDIYCEDSVVFWSGVAYDTCDFIMNGTTSQVVNTISPYTGNYFLAKIDTSGVPLLLRYFRSTEDLQHIEINRDDNKNTYITCQFGGAIDADPSTGVASHVVGSTNDNVLMIKLDPQGNYLWSKDFGSAYLDFFHSATWTGTDLLLVGAIPAIAFLVKSNGDSITLSPTNMPNLNGYIVKVNASGDYQWAYTMRGGANRINHITSHANGDFTISGTYSDSVNVGFGASSYWLPHAMPSQQGFYIAKYDVQANLIWAKQIVDSNNTLWHDAHDIDNDGNAILVGSFMGPDSSDFDPGIGLYQRKPLFRDGTILKLGNCSTSSATLPIHACDKFRSPQNNIYDSAGIYLESYYNIA
ncbi:MAG: hypothetical protein RL660_2148, partial [Bacteroidota bacterium]